MEIRVSGAFGSALLLGGGPQGAGGVRPGYRARGLCQCESGSGASLDVLPGEGGPQPFSPKPQSLTGTCVFRQESVATSGSSVGVQRRENMCAEKKPAVAGFSASVFRVWMAPVHGG